MKLAVIRANAGAPFGIEHRDKAFVIDKWGCLLFLVKKNRKGRTYKKKHKFVPVDFIDGRPFIYPELQAERNKHHVRRKLEVG